MNDMRFYIVLSLCSCILSSCAVAMGDVPGMQIRFLSLLGVYNAIETGNATRLEKIINDLDGRLAFDTILLRAAEIGDEEVVEVLIRNGAQVNAGDGDDLTSMHFAALNSNEKVIETLMKHGGNVNAPSYSRTTPLHLSAINKNEKVMELLLNSGADPNFVDKNDKSPLFYAAMNPNEKLTELLIKKGADVKHASNSSEATYLDFACLNSNEKIAELLIKAGADVNARGLFGLTPIFYAILNGEKEANDLCDTYRPSNMFTASIDAKVVKFCAKQFDQKNNASEKMIDLLIKNGANINQNADDADLPQPYEIAQIIGDEKMMELLIKYGATLKPQ